MGGGNSAEKQLGLVLAFQFLQISIVVHELRGEFETTGAVSEHNSRRQVLLFQFEWANVTRIKFRAFALLFNPQSSVLALRIDIIADLVVRFLLSTSISICGVFVLASSCRSLASETLSWMSMSGLARPSPGGRATVGDGNRSVYYQLVVGRIARA
jgi:hypothetical protein